MALYPVIVDWIPGLPQIPYRNGVGQWEGVVMHYTGTPNDSARSERAYESRTFQNAFVHEFIDPDEIIQVANPEYIAYGAGSQANPRFIHLELCSAQSTDEFERSFDMWCQRAAFFLAERQLGVSVAKPDGSGTLWGHFQVSNYLGGTNHVDPVEYLQQWGYSWEDAVARVQSHYDQLVYGGSDNPNPGGDDEIMLSAEDANKIIGFLSAAWAATESAEAREEFHRLANELRRASGQPEE